MNNQNEVNQTPQEVQRQDMNGSKKIIMGMAVIIAILLLIIVVMAVSGGKNKKGGDSTTQTNATMANNSTSSSENGTIGGNEESSSTQETTTKAPEKFDVKYNYSNDWENNGTYFKQFDFVIDNNSEDDVKDWEVIIDVAEGTEVNSAWNCNCYISEGKLYLNAKDFFNNEIASGAQVKDMGAIIASPNKSPLSEKYAHNLTTVSKPEEEKSTESAENKTEENKTEESKTEESTTQAPTTAPKEDVIKPSDAPGSAVSNHGALSVSGTQIVDKNGKPYRLCGVSTHGLQWFPQYVNKDTFKYLRDDWGANVIRLAMYTREGGYLQGDKAKIKQTLENGVQYATELGMYVIIDWHVLNYNPKDETKQAVEFFEEMAKKYAGYDNIIYEICNEPTGSPWESAIKPYATEVVAAIRKHDKDAIIIVGTNTWSQDVDDVIGKRIENDKNVMYAAHFYASTHGDNIRNKVQKAIDAGIPVFISECSICDASGSGSVNYSEADKWFELLDKNNVSYVCWNLCNKNETSALIAASVSSDKLSGFKESELSVTGVWFRKKIREDLGVE